MGLESINTIGGDLEIDQNDALIHLFGLKSLNAIGGGLSIAQNDALTNLIGLEGLTSIGGGLGISGNDALTSMIGLESLNTIAGDLRISHNDALTSMIGLESLNTIAGELRISGNAALTNLAGLESLVSVGGSLTIGWYSNGDNPSLINLDGLISLSSVGDKLWISYNPELNCLNGLSGLTSIGGSFYIAHNLILNSLEGLDNIEASSIEALYIYDNPALSTCNVESVCAYLVSPNGFTLISDNASGCENEQVVESACNMTSVNDVNLFKEIKLYPNPASQKLNISADGFNIDEIRIFTLTGQYVLNQEKPTGNIDISGLKPGMYIVEARVEGKKVRRKLLVE
jgi:hypothetical protein